MPNVRFNINIDGVQVAPAFNEVRIQVVTDRLTSQYLNLTLTSEGMIVDLMDDVTSEVLGTVGRMWDEVI